MTERARREYAAVMRARYAQADKRARGRLLDEYCRTTGCHRKAAIRRLRRRAHPTGRSPGRPGPYAAQSWRRSSSAPGWPAISSPASCCAPSCPALLTALVTHHGLRLAPAVRTALTGASAATLDRLLRPLRRRRPRQPRRLAPRPTRSGPRSRCAPGASGPAWPRARCKAISSCIVASPPRGSIALPSWPSTWPPAGRSCRPSGACTSSGSPAPSSTSPERLPFPLREWHRDNGSEFVNAACSAGAATMASASPAAGPIARTTRPGSSSATASSSAASSATTATAPARPGRSCSASTACFACSTTSSARCASSCSKRRVGSKVLQALRRRPHAVPAGARRRRPHRRTAPGPGAQFHTRDPIALARDIQRTLDVLWKLADTRPPVRRPPMGNTILRPRPRRSVTPLSEASRGVSEPSTPEFDLRVDVMPAEAVVAWRVDAVAIPHDQGDALREGDRQIGADAGEAGPGQTMVPDVVDPRVVGEELEVDAVLAGPDRGTDRPRSPARSVARRPPRCCSRAASGETRRAGGGRRPCGRRTARRCPRRGPRSGTRSPGCPRTCRSRPRGSRSAG